MSRSDRVGFSITTSVYFFVSLMGCLGVVWGSFLWNPLLGWGATSILLLILPQLWKQPLVCRGRERLGSLWSHDFVQRWFAYVFVTLVLIVALWPIPVGVLPISQDHGNHYLATHIFVYDMIGQGQLFGWTDRIGIGLPFGDVYGTMAYLATGGLTLLSFGLIPLSFSYAFGIFLVWWIPSMAVVAWGRRLSVGVIPPVVAGCLLVYDAGGDREGGWLYSMFHGVWPQFLATGVWLWTLLTLIRLMEKPTWRRFGVVILCTGLSLWSHPMNAINLPLSAGLLVLWFLIQPPSHNASVNTDTERSKDPLAQGALWCVIALVLGAVVGCVWLIRLMVAAPYLGEYTAYWKSLPVLMQQMLEGKLFDNQIVVFGLFSLVGLLGVWRQQSRLGWFTILLCAGFLLLGSMDLLAYFDLGLHPKHKLFMFRRLSVSIKPFWFLFAGIGTAMVWNAIRQTNIAEVAPWSVKILLALAIAPLVWSTAFALPRLFTSPVGRTLTAERAGLSSHLGYIRETMFREQKRTPKRTLRMIQWRGGSGSYGLFPVADLRWASIPTSNPPCHAFVWGNARPNFEMMKWFGATHLLSYVPRKLPGVTLLIRAGRYHLYRIEVKTPSYPVTLEGPGKVEVLSWKPMLRELRLSGITDKSRLLVGLPPYHKWHPTQGTRRLTMKLFPHKGYRLSQISGLRNGAFTLQYKDKVIERVCLWMGGVVLLLALVCLGVGGSPLPAILPVSWGQWIRLSMGWILVAGCVCGVVMLVVWKEDALHSEYAETNYPHVLGVLHRDGLASFSYGPKPYCVPPFNRSLRMSCREDELTPRVVSGPRRWDRVPTSIRVVPGAENYTDVKAEQSQRLGIRFWHRIPSCLKFGVPGRGKSVLRFRLPAGTRLLKGRFHGEREDMGRIFLIQGKAHFLKKQDTFRLKVKAGMKEILVVLHNHRETRNLCLELVAVK